MNTETKSLGETLKAWRTNNGYSVWQIAKFEGDGRTDNYTRLEKGENCTTETLMKYLDFIRCKDPDYDVIRHVWVRCGYCSSEEDLQEFEDTVLEQAVKQLDAEE